MTSDTSEPTLQQYNPTAGYLSSVEDPQIVVIRRDHESEESAGGQAIARKAQKDEPGTTRNRYRCGETEGTAREICLVLLLVN